MLTIRKEEKKRKQTLIGKHINTNIIERTKFWNKDWNLQSSSHHLYKHKPWIKNNLRDKLLRVITKKADVHIYGSVRRNENNLLEDFPCCGHCTRQQAMSASPANSVSGQLHLFLIVGCESSLSKPTMLIQTQHCVMFCWW